MVFTLGRIKTQVRPLTQGIGTRELNFQIMPRSNWDLTPENVVQDHHRAKHPDKGPRQHWKDRMSGPSPRDWGQTIYGQQVLVIPNVHSEWPVSLELMMTLKHQFVGVVSTLPREVVCPLVGRSLNNKNTHKIINKLLYNGIHMIYDIYHTPYHGITVGSGTDSE